MTVRGFNSSCQSTVSHKDRYPAHPQRGRCLRQASSSTRPYMEHTFSSIIHNLGGMLNNWSELGGLSAQQSFACSWWICGIQCTLQGERGNIVLSCVSVFYCAFIDQLFSLALWLWPAVLRRGPSLLSQRRVCDSVCFSYCAAFHAPASTLLYSVSHKTHSNFSLKCSYVVRLWRLALQILQ